MEPPPTAAENDEPTRLEGDALEACLALQPVATLLACRRVSSVWRAAALGVLSSSTWQASVPLLVLLDHGAPAAAVRARLRAAPSDLCVEGKGGRSPLHYALMRRVRGETVLALLAADAKAARTMGQGKMLALHVAASHGAGADVVLSLVAAHPGAARERAKGFKLPLHFAAAHHSVPLDALEALLDAHPAGVTARACDGCLPLHLAVASSKASTIAVELLLRRGAAGAREPGRNGMLPLHMAAEHGAPSAVVRALLREYAAGARVADRSGSLPLHLAIAAGAPVVTKLLMDAHPVDASWTLDLLLKLCGWGGEAALAKIASEPGCAQQDELSGNYPFHLAVFYQASQQVLDALLGAAPGAANVKFM